MFDDGVVGVCVLCLMFVLLVWVVDFGFVGLCVLCLRLVLLCCVHYACMSVGLRA